MNAIQNLLNLYIVFIDIIIIYNYMLINKIIGWIMNKKKIYITIMLLLMGFFILLNANHSHLITKVENMIETDDTYYITNFIKINTDYRSLGSFYEELLDSLAVHNKDFEYVTIFARAGAYSLLDKAEELKYNNSAMSNKLKKSTVKILNQAIDGIYNQWLDKENEGTFLLKNALDMMKLSYRINTQFQNDLSILYFNYISYGEIYLALNDFSSAQEYFKGAKDLSSQLETQEYADIADVYIKLSASNSSLAKDGTIFDYADFITLYQDYQIKFNDYKKYVSDKAEPDFASEENENQKMDAMNVSLQESQEWLRRLSRINNRVFGDYNFVKINTRQ